MQFLLVFKKDKISIQNRDVEPNCAIPITYFTPVFQQNSLLVHSRRPQERARGALAQPLEFEKVTSYAAVLQNTLKFSLAPEALAIDTLYFSLKRREKNANIFVCVFGAPKNGQFFVRHAENVSTF